jgi:ectoine hydroxylase-related dioxygenase (phytanoyl-CoA dioxygenase family)
MLSKTQVAQYHEAGYVVPDFRLRQDQLAEIKAAHDRLLARKPEYRDYCPAILEHDLWFLNVARDPEILDMVGQVLGPDFALWNSSFFAKPARNGRRTPWHQDGEYWPIRPVATCTVWIAIDAATVENGCLRLIPGSHKARELLAHETNPSPEVTLSQELPGSAFDESRAVDLVLEPGQMSLHDVFMVHGSEANVSAHPRRGMTLRFMPTTSVFDRELADDLYRRIGTADHSRRTLFLMRGRDRSGRNDFAMRH